MQTAMTLHRIDTSQRVEQVRLVKLRRGFIQHFAQSKLQPTGPSLSKDPRYQSAILLNEKTDKQPKSLEMHRFRITCDFVCLVRSRRWLLYVAASEPVALTPSFSPLSPTQTKVEPVCGIILTDQI